MGFPQLLTWIAGNEGSRQAGSSDSYLKSLSFNFQDETNNKERKK